MALYSYSKFETFKHCPRKFYYRYVAKVPLEEEPEFIAPFLGSRVHDALESIYARIGQGIVPTECETLDCYRRQWTAEWTNGIVIPDGAGSPEDFCRLGEQWVSSYYRRYAPFNDATLIGLEMPVFLALDGDGQHTMRGYVDRLAKTPAGVWQIHDYKTNNRLPTQADMDQAPQLAFYEIAIRQMWPDVEQVELVWHYVRFDQTIRSRRSADQLTSLKQETLSLVAEIESRDRDEAAFPTHDSKLCDYCEYQAVCPVRKHLVAVKQLPQNKFLKEPGVKLVDRWTELKAKQQELQSAINELELEIDEIKEALLALAEREDMTSVVGSEKQVLIVEENKVLFPRKGQEPEQAAELEAKLRRSPWWEQVSTVDRTAIAALWKDREQQASALRKLLKEYVWVEDQTTIRLRNRRG